MSKGLKKFSAVYALLIMLIGFAVLGSQVMGLQIDLWREYIVFIVLGILLEWLVLPLPTGNLSVGFSLVLTSFMIYGSAATAWIATLSALFSQGIFNRGNPLRTTLFNGAQYALVVYLAGVAYQYAYEYCNVFNSGWQNWLAVFTFIIVHYLANHILINIYLAPEYGQHTVGLWKAALKYDAITYVFAAPLALLMRYLYGYIGIKGVALLFVLVLILKYLLKISINLELANKELKALYHVAKTIGGSIEIESTLNIILEESRRVIKYHTGAVYLFKENQNVLIPAAVNSPYAKQIRNTEVKVGEGIIGKVALNREPELVDDTRKDPDYDYDTGLCKFMRSMIIFPLIADDHIVGVMVVAKREPHGFNKKQLQSMTILGAQAAVATAKALLYKRIEAMAITDGLTKVFNHRYFQHRLEQEYMRSKRYKSSFALIMLDIDFFKKFNDTYGHKAGDRALVNVARQIQNSIRTVDVLARYGGEEFVVILPETPKHRAIIIAERIREAVKAAPFEVHPAKPLVSVSVSVGVAGFPDDASNFHDLVEAADKALYSAKHGGRNRVCIYEDKGNG